MARTASRIVGMISRASTESGFNPNVAFKMTLPSITLTAVSGAPGIAGERRMGSTDATPLIFNSCAETASADDSLTNTSVGWPEPPGKCCPSSSNPTTESGR